MLSGWKLGTKSTTGVLIEFKICVSAMEEYISNLDNILANWCVLKLVYLCICVQFSDFIFCSSAFNIVLHNSVVLQG